MGAVGARSIQAGVGARALVVPVPGSKSLTNRWIALTAMARGRSVLRGPLVADDPRALVTAIEACGAMAQWHLGSGSASQTTLEVHGVGGAFHGNAQVNLGDGGTPTRFMMALASLADGPVLVDGSNRMRERPVAEGVALLEQLGARARWVDSPGRLPVELGLGRPHGGALRIGATTSSQFISALMLIAPWLERGLTLEFMAPPTSGAYIELSLAVLRAGGAAVGAERGVHGALTRVVIEPRPLGPWEITIEPDASSAVYPLAAAALVPGLSVTVPGLPRQTAQPDRGAIDALVAMGATELSEGAATTIAWGGPLRGITVDASQWPDGALAIAAVAAAAAGVTRISGLRTLRVKESDRIAAMAGELGAIGCTVSSTDDSLVIDPSTRHDAAVTLHAHRDHRVAMSLAVLGLVRPGISIDDPGCVSKSWPGFWSAVQALEGG